MTIFQAIILGLVQGLGEFLPISSSGHLVLTPWIFGWEDPGLAFDVALHLGTLIAVAAYFWRDFLAILGSVFGFRFLKNEDRDEKGNAKRNIKKEDEGQVRAAELDLSQNYPQNFLFFIILATVPGALAGLFLEDQAETIFREPLLTAAMLFGAGLILYLADKFSSAGEDRKGLFQITAQAALIIGLAQALAIVPGVSRSGATITAALFLGFSRVAAARFSFLLSAPIIFGAVILKFGDFLAAGVGPAEIVGILTAAVSGYLAIAGLIKFVEKVSYRVFFWYRLVLAVLIVVMWVA